MNTFTQRRAKLDLFGLWEQFCQWVASTDNRLYIGWFAALGMSTMAFNLNGFNFQHSVLDAQGRGIATNAGMINRADLGIQAMHSPHAHHVPLQLASGDAVPYLK